MFEQCPLHWTPPVACTAPVLSRHCSLLTVIMQTSWRSSALSARDIVFEMTRSPPWQLHTSGQLGSVRSSTCSVHCMQKCRLLWTLLVAAYRKTLQHVVVCVIQYSKRTGSKILRECYWFCKTIQVCLVLLWSMKYLSDGDGAYMKGLDENADS